ncbi:response regulator [Geomonas sp. RF6]|uniref:response regulator transcription factor n=1 Tax=Geomonas sp. RF6 TaxID=2897342 RepID=UPI001E5BAB95|nr:response regulator [Geomonas sp. RF6]UFS69446.1 response regulator [Geomonas sp. RF6]
MSTLQSDLDISLLMVEDDPVARNVILRMVERRFPACTIYTAENGREGLELYKQHSPELVISDINMPEMNGIDMAREIRTIDPDARFIVLTAYGNQSFLQTFTEIGFCAYLLKPVNFKELFTIIESCVGKSGGGG